MVISSTNTNFFNRNANWQKLSPIGVCISCDMASESHEKFLSPMGTLIKKLKNN